MKLKFVLFPALTLALFTGCGGDDDNGNGPTLPEKPQILPDLSPICLIYSDPFFSIFGDEPIVVGATVQQNIQLRNDGKENLVISNGVINGDTRSHFQFVGIDPMTVESRDSAISTFRYKPQAEGWDTATFDVTSNAENYPSLSIRILAVARTTTVGAAVTDPGPRPTEAGEACHVCGDGLQFAIEECDDGNTENGDGCSAECKRE